MNLKQCYDVLGGNYEEICGRIPGEAMIVSFLRKFLEDPTFHTLLTRIECGNRDEAFRAAHTLKGISANFSFTKLWKSVSALTEELRVSDTIPDTAAELMQRVIGDYNLVTRTVCEYLNQESDNN